LKSLKNLKVRFMLQKLFIKRFLYIIISLLLFNSFTSTKSYSFNLKKSDSRTYLISKEIDSDGAPRKLIFDSNSPITDQEAIEYIEDFWEITDLTDGVIRETFPVEYDGIPYKDWITFFIEIEDVIDELRVGDYENASNEAAKIAAEGIFDLAFANRCHL
jgi:hypothetical protein